MYLFMYYCVKGSWNWRIKIPIELPIKAREMGRLKIQVIIYACGIYS
jgi:hypothetical protein